MRVFFLSISLAFLGQHCLAQANPRKEVYSWISFQSIPRDSTGKMKGIPVWSVSNKMDLPYDTFVVSKNHDTIMMINSYKPAGDPFKKVQIQTSRWKPKLSYHNTYFFLGTYELARLDGLYMSYYATKDWNSLLQITYTNPGNMMGVTLFSKDSSNIFRRDHIIVDPKEEQTEPDHPIR